jgi:hypothetical protein
VDSETKAPKRIYTPPTLRSLGDVREVTQAGAGGVLDDQVLANKTG